MARPIGTDSTRTGGKFVAGPLDRYVLQEMLVSVADVVAEPLSGKRYAIRDPLTMETLGHAGMKTLKPEWMRDHKKGAGEYFEPEETALVVQSLLDGVWPKTAKRDRIAEAIDTALYADAELEKGRAFGAGVDPRALPAAGDPDAVPFDVPALPTSRPRVGLDDETGTLVLAARSPLKGRYSQVNPPAKSKHELALFASQEYREQRRKGLTPKAASEEATRQVWEHFPREARRFGVPAPVGIQGSLFTVPRVVPRGGLRPSGAQADDLGPLFGGSEGPGLFGNPKDPTLQSWGRGWRPRISKYWVLVAPRIRGYGNWWLVYQVDRPKKARGISVLGPFWTEEEAVKQAREHQDAIERNPLTRPEVREIRSHARYYRHAGELMAAKALETEARLYSADSYRRGLSTEPNPLTRSETADVLVRARMAGKLARTFSGWPEGVARAAKMAAYQESARDFGQAGGPAGRAARRALRYGPPMPGDPDYTPNPLTRNESAALVRDARRQRLYSRDVLTKGDAIHAAMLRGYAGAEEDIAYSYLPTSQQRRGGRPLYPKRWRQMYPKTHLNPPARVLGPIPGRMKEIRYQRTGSDRGPYFHKFGPNVRAFACADGSVILRGPRPLFVNQ
jgi:hypothetical protein